MLTVVFLALASIYSFYASGIRFINFCYAGISAFMLLAFYVGDGVLNDFMLNYWWFAFAFLICDILNANADKIEAKQQRVKDKIQSRRKAKHEQKITNENHEKTSANDSTFNLKS